MLMTLEQAKNSLRQIGLSVTTSTLRKCARAKSLLDSGNITASDIYGNPLSAHEISEGYGDGKWRDYRVTNQSDNGLHYQVMLNGTLLACNCPDKAEICKHRIAAMLYEHRQAYITDSFDEWEKERQDWEDRWYSQDESAYLQWCEERCEGGY